MHSGLLLALLVVAIRCDETCDQTLSNWRYDPNAWQWLAQLGFAALGLVGAVGTLALLNARVYRFATASMAVHAVGWTAWGLLIGPIVVH